MRIPAAARVVIAVIVAAGAIALPWLTVPSDPWFDAAAAIKADNRPGDLVVLMPSKHAGRLHAFGRLWAVALEPRQLPLARAFSRIFVVSRGPVRFDGRGWVEESMRSFGPIQVRLMGRQPGGTR